MNYHIDIQHACEEIIPIEESQLKEWIEACLTPHTNSAELTLRFVSTQEMTTLNHTYRKKNKVTNVLAFPAKLPSYLQLDVPLLGDVIICPAVLKDESEAFARPLVAYWAHIIIHGILHLLGYDHIQEDDAAIMQQFEIETLHRLGFDNPYSIEEAGKSV